MYWTEGNRRIQIVGLVARSDKGNKHIGIQLDRTVNQSHQQMEINSQKNQ
jgi:hypothetical protein